MCVLPKTPAASMESDFVEKKSEKQKTREKDFVIDVLAREVLAN
jgi:hypothetical protein